MAPFTSGTTTPFYTGYGNLRLTLNGIRTGARNPNARIAVINTSRTYDGDGLMMDHWLWSSHSTETDTDGVTTIFTPTRFLARALDTSWTYGIADDDTFKVILYEATGPISSYLLED